MVTYSRAMRSFFGIILILILSACAAPERTVQVSASSVVPLDSLQDWVTYGDYFGVMTVVSERRIEPSDAERERGEGTIGREITVRFSDSAWTRPTLREELSVPSEFVTGGGFWIFNGREESRAQIEGRPWLEVDKSFFALVSYIDPEFHANPEKPVDEADPHWGPLVFLTIDGDRLGPVESSEFPALAQLSGKTLGEIGSTLEDTAPDPKARPFMDEDPALRYQHVAASD